ncbi:MAG TPA: toll/interleukin-1 receptor domain-containing protein [Anaerolineales bacterium]|nr:toll/interleukin-1 receptor domain-containing protein [Anaerolineales bacterium]
MTKNIFMSYSRRELGFVDDLVSKLEGEGYSVWLDYRVLIPGTPWKGQIAKGLNDADTVLLVVSKASIASEYVELEWRHFLDMNKRVILLIFEAVDIPTELEKYEWVDFRGNYKAGLEELFSQLKQPIQEEHPVPEAGFKVPGMVWLAFGTSLLAAFSSLYVIWTLFIPWILVPLPYRIFKRNYNFTQVQAALIMLPVALLFSTFISDLEEQFVAVWNAMMVALVAGIALLFILRSAALQRWGKPEATIPRYANPYNVDTITPQPVSFFVDYAVQDRAAAEDLIDALKKHGHTQAADIHSAHTVLVVISRFKANTEADPEKQVVFPVMIQYNDDIDQKLQKIQWIDFRPGVRKLEAIAKLLDNPAGLLKALGMRPVSSQTVYSPIITTIYYFMIYLTAFTVGSSFKYFLSSIDSLLNLSDETFGNVFLGLILQMILFGVLTFFVIRGVTTRKGWFASFGILVLSFLIIGVLLFWQMDMAGIAGEELEATIGSDTTNIAALLPFLIYFVGIIVMIVVFFRNRRDIQRWFPARKQSRR